MWKNVLLFIIILCFANTCEAGRFRNFFYRGSYYNDYDNEEPEKVENPKPKKTKPEPKVIFQEVKIDYFGVSDYNKFMAVEINPYLGIN